MTKLIEAHSDGRVIIPNDPIELPTERSFQVMLMLPEDARPQVDREEALRRVSRALGFLNHAVPSDEALRRESIYGDD